MKPIDIANSDKILDEFKDGCAYRFSYDLFKQESLLADSQMSETFKDLDGMKVKVTGLRKCVVGIYAIIPQWCIEEVPAGRSVDDIVSEVIAEKIEKELKIESEIIRILHGYKCTVSEAKGILEQAAITIEETGQIVLPEDIYI